MKKTIKKLLPLAAVLLAAAMLVGCGSETDKPAGTSGIGQTSGITDSKKDTGTEKPSAPLRITCVGDSITFGECATTPDASYPSVMAGILGDGYIVENCGKSGAAVINGETAILYTSTVEYQKSLESTPDVVIMMLGTNAPKMTGQPKRRPISKQSISRSLIPTPDLSPSRRSSLRPALREQTQRRLTTA